jgi:putative endonuclease
MYFVYILQSKKDHRYYVGVSENVERRLREHNAGGSKSTAPYRPWTIIKIEEYPDAKLAYKRERFIKSKHSRIIIEKIVSG